MHIILLLIKKLFKYIIIYGPFYAFIGTDKKSLRAVQIGIVGNLTRYVTLVRHRFYRKVSKLE